MSPWGEAVIHSLSRFFGKADIEPCLCAAGAAECYGMKCGACARILLQRWGGLVGFVLCFLWSGSCSSQCKAVSWRHKVQFQSPFFSSRAFPPKSKPHKPPRSPPKHCSLSQTVKTKQHLCLSNGQEGIKIWLEITLSCYLEGSNPQQKCCAC